MIKLLQQSRANVALADAAGKTPIDLAAANKLTADAVAALLDGPAMQSAPSACLVAAASISDTGLVKAAIAAKAAVDQMSKDRLAQLQRVTQNQNQEIARLLIEAGYSLNVSRSSRKRPLEELYLN